MAIHTVVTCLWFNGEGRAAAEYYVSLLPNSRMENVELAKADNPSMKEGGELVVNFVLNGTPYQILNGGPNFPQNEAVSLSVQCDTQEELDHLWTGLLKDGGKESVCGWLKDRWGVSWQIYPTRLMELMGDPNPDVARAVTQQMMDMVKLDIAPLEAAAAAARQ